MQQFIDREIMIERLKKQLNWHKKELARLDHELVDKCDRVNKLQQAVIDLENKVKSQNKELESFKVWGSEGSRVLFYKEREND